LRLLQRAVQLTSETIITSPRLLRAAVGLYLSAQRTRRFQLR